MMTSKEIFNKMTEGEVFLVYINDKGNSTVCRTDEPSEVIRLMTEEGARVIPFDTLLRCYEVYKSCDENKEEIPLVTFSDWIIGEV